MKTLLILLVTFFTTLSASAHYLWIETESRGVAGREQQIRVHYGEYTYGVVEEVAGEGFPLVANFQLWVLAPDGRKTVLETVAAKDHYAALFTPTLPGTYTIAVNNNEIEVLDYTQYDFGIFKTHYHATASVQVGSETNPAPAANPEGLAVTKIPHDGTDIRLRVLYKGEPLPNNEVTVYVADLWSKTLETDAEGTISFGLPWKTRYIVEATLKEEVPGSYQGKEYQFIWHCATFCIE